jgi:hypothetical protein
MVMSFKLEEDLIQNVFDNARTKYELSDITKLPPIIANFILVYAAQGVIDNGGYRYFFGADWPNNPPYQLFIDAYRAIECENQAKDIERIIASFPFDNPHLHAGRRKQYINDNYDHERGEIKEWGDPLCGDDEIWSKLEAYVIKNKLEFLWLLPQLQIPEVTSKQECVSGPIHDAAKSGDLEKVKTLLKDNPELVSHIDEDGEMPLHLAAQNGHKDMVELLLANNANVNANSKNNWTPLQEAVIRRHKDVAEFLVSNQANLNARIVFGYTLLHMLVVRNIKDMVAFVLAKGADVNAKDDQGNTPLHKASSMGYKDLVELLVANRADVNVRNNEDATPLRQAIENGRNDVAELLSQHGGSRLKLVLPREGLGTKTSNKSSD